MPGRFSICESSKTDCALSVTGPKLSTAMVTGPMPRNPKATRPKAKMGPAKANAGGMRPATEACCAKWLATTIRARMTSPIQNAEKLPATKPERILSEAPPWREEVTISWTCRDLVLVNTRVNSGMTAPAMVPRLMITERVHQRPSWPGRSPSSR